MMPDKVVGSVITADGRARPFVLDATSGEVRWDVYEPASPLQRMMTSADAVLRRVKKHSRATAVRLGQYACPHCGNWIDVVEQPVAWSKDRCSDCNSTAG